MDIHVREAVPTDAGRSAPCTIGRGWRAYTGLIDPVYLQLRAPKRARRCSEAKLPGDPCRRGGRAGRRLLRVWRGAGRGRAGGLGRSAVFTSCGRTSAAASGKACWPARRRRSGRRGSGKRTSGFCAKMTARSVYERNGFQFDGVERRISVPCRSMKSDTAARFEKAPQGPADANGGGLCGALLFSGGFLHDEARLDAVVPEAAQRVFYRSARRTRRSGSPAGSRHWRSRARGRDSFPPAAARWGKHGAAAAQRARAGGRQRRRGQDRRAALHGAQRALEAAEIFGRGAPG